MAFISSGKRYKKRAEQALANARLVQDYQSEQEFRRQMLSNIRQERIARAQLLQGNYSTTARTSSQQGALANIDSSLAGETYFSYASSDRAKQIQDYNDQAEYWNRKYQKKQKRLSQTVGVVTSTVGAVIGGFIGGPAGAMAGAQIGQGVGQIGLGNSQQGVNNIISGIGQGWLSSEKDKQWQQYLQMIRENRYELASVDPQTNQIIPGSRIGMGTYNVLSGIKGYY